MAPRIPRSKNSRHRKGKLYDLCLTTEDLLQQQYFELYGAKF